MARDIRSLLVAATAALAFLIASTQVETRAGDSRRLTVGATTTLENSGLMDRLMPAFEAATGIRVRLVVRGTGEVLRAARSGDVDVFLAHDKAAEADFVARGHGVGRRDVMYNHFVIVGPADDPAGVRAMGDAAAALAKIAAAASPFVSRGDDSGTHRAERRYWRAAGIEPDGSSDRWYLEAGAGMGSVLNIAAGRDFYTLTDRGTWLSFGNRRRLEILVQGDRGMINQYGVTLVNPARHPHVRSREGRAFSDWITSTEGQRAIGDYRVNGERLFIPNARPKGS